jgi:hypothetical protein
MWNAAQRGSVLDTKAALAGTLAALDFVSIRPALSQSVPFCCLAHIALTPIVFLP